MRVLITGAAKRVGKSLCKYFAEKGYDVILHVNKSLDEGNELLSALRKEYPRQSFNLFQFDLCDWKRLSDHLNHIFNNEMLPDVIVHNASNYLKKSLSDLSTTDIEEMMAIHLYSPMMINQQFIKMGGAGNIINILDSAILSNSTKHSMYLLAKKSLAEYTKMAAVEFAPDIRINGIALGPVLPPDGEDGDYFEKVVNNTPLKQKVSLDSVHSTISYLIDNPNITGQIIYCDSGQHLS